ncbi:MAG: phage tail tape measure protein [Desulfovibrio sp.]
MGKSTEIAVVLRLRDEMAGRAAKSLEALTRAAKGVGQGAGAAARQLGRLDRAGDGVRAVGIAAADTDKLMGGLGQTARRAAREVSDVGRAGNAVKSVGTMAYEALHGLDQAARAGNRLRDALRGVGAAGRAALGAVKGIGQFGAGATAGAMVAGRALARPISFEKRLALMANTAYANRDVAGRIAGMQGLEKAVNTAVRQGGGGRDQAAEALDSMLASGAVKADAAKRLLPTIQKVATSSGTSSSEIAEIAIRGIQQGFFSEDQVGEALDKAMAAGQAGGFELKDSAKWLPKMMALGSGMKSMAGFEQLLAYAQAAAVTAGSRDEAGNNLVNLLQKLNSQDTRKDFAKLGIDLTGTLTRAREQGMLPLEAIAKLVEKEVVGKDKRYAKLKAKLDKAQGGERQQILSDMADLANASAVGRVFQDRQALLALIAAMTQKGYVADVQKQMKNAQGTGEKAYQVYRSTTDAHLESTANEADIARSRMLGDVGGPLKAAADAATDLARRFPTLATMATEAATAIGTMSAAAAAFGAMRLFTGGAGGGAAAAVGSGGLLGMFGGKGGLLATAGLAAWDIYATESNDALTRAQKNVRHSENAGGLAGAIAGMKLGAAGGAALGSVVPGLGTAAGGIVGGLAGGAAGWWAGSDLGRWAGEKLWGPSTQAKADAQKVVVEDKSTLHVESVLHLDGREVARAVNDYNTADAKRE